MSGGYNYIVVGAGSAGAALAARLSENADRQVLLVDAGPDYRSEEVPAAVQAPNPHTLLADETYQVRWRAHGGVGPVADRDGMGSVIGRSPHG